MTEDDAKELVAKWKSVPPSDLRIREIEQVFVALGFDPPTAGGTHVRQWSHKRLVGSDACPHGVIPLGKHDGEDGIYEKQYIRSLVRKIELTYLEDDAK